MLLALPTFRSNFPFVSITLLLGPLFVTLSLYLFTSELQACLGTYEDGNVISIEKLDLSSCRSAILSKRRFGITDALEKLIRYIWILDGP